MSDNESLELLAKRIKNYTTGEIVHIMHNVQEPVAKNVLITQLFNTKAAPSIAALATMPPKKLKKALNGFIGYRSWLKAIPFFHIWPMKNISSYIGQLWKYEPDKPLWTLMTKAWSAIRDQVGNDIAPLDQFLDIVCTELNVLPPTLYLQGRGWNIEYNSEGAPTLSRDPTSSSAAALGYGFKGQTLSVADIIEICQKRGYATGYVLNKDDSSPTFLGCNPQAIRFAARNKRRDRRQTARESPAAQALRQESDEFLAAIPKSTLPEDESRDPTGFYSHILGILSEYNVADPTASAVEPSNSDIAASALLSNNTDMFVATDMSAFRVGANANAVLPPFDPNNFQLG